MKQKLSIVLIYVFGGPWLGHGRAMESFLTLVSGSYGLGVLLDARIPFDSQATRDIAWMGYGWLICFPLLVKAGLSGYGLIANILGLPFSRPTRFIGALVGSMIWAWFICKFALIGEAFTLGSFFCFYAFVYSIRIMALSLANRPIPGAPGIL